MLGMADTIDAPPRDPAPHLPPPTAGRWARRLVILALLVGAGAILWYGGSRAQTGLPTDRDPVIVAQFPAPDARALRQTELGAELKTGYDGRLVINGTAIPESQMQGAVDPKTLTAAELARYGVRPNNRNRVLFLPGPGKVIESLPTGEVEIVLRYFKDRQDEGTGRTIRWTVHVD